VLCGGSDADVGPGQEEVSTSNEGPVYCRCSLPHTSEEIADEALRRTIYTQAQLASLAGWSDELMRRTAEAVFGIPRDYEPSELFLPPMFRKP
jgi:hypothetical protein